MKIFTLPSLGSDMDEGKLLEWRVRPGDSVERGQVLAVVDTSKAAVDVETWNAGRVALLLAQPGTVAKVGTPLALLAEPGESLEEVAARAADLSPPVASGAEQAQAPVTAAQAPSAARAAPPAAVRRRVSPAARKHAAVLGLEIEQIEGTGPGGAVTLQDVERARPGATGEAPVSDQAVDRLQARPGPEAAGAEGERREAMRRAIGAAMSRSKREIPHYYLRETVPLLHATRWLETRNAGRPLPQRLLMAALQAAAVARAADEFKDFNGFFRDGAYQPGPAVHLGIAISLRGGGLVAPALHDCAHRSLDETMSGLVDLVTRARAGSLRSSEMSDPTITLSNLGERGVEAVQGIIYPPQVALVGFGRIAERPWAEEGALRAMPVVVATLAADHRVSDGHRGALFLARIAQLLQDPAKLEGGGSGG